MSPPIELRTRTPLGAVYRSPLGALGPGAAAPVADYVWVADVINDSVTGRTGYQLDCTRNTMNGGPFLETVLTAQVFDQWIPKALGSSNSIQMTGAVSGYTYTWSPPPSCFVSGQETKPLPSEGPGPFYPYEGFNLDGGTFDFYVQFLVNRATSNPVGWQAAEDINITIL